MSRTTSRVPTCASRGSPERSAQRAAYVRFFSSTYAIPAGLMSTSASRRSASLSCGVRQRTWGVDAPIPLGSKPIMSNRSASSVPSVIDAELSPDAPGPPGLTRMEPSRAPVAGAREIAICAVSPAGAA